MQEQQKFIPTIVPSPSTSTTPPASSGETTASPQLMNLKLASTESAPSPESIPLEESTQTGHHSTEAIHHENLQAERLDARSHDVAELFDEHLDAFIQDDLTNSSGDADEELYIVYQESSNNHAAPFTHGDKKQEVDKSVKDGLANDHREPVPKLAGTHDDINSLLLNETFHLEETGTGNTSHNNYDYGYNAGTNSSHVNFNYDYDYNAETNSSHVNSNYDYDYNAETNSSHVNSDYDYDYNAETNSSNVNSDYDYDYNTGSNSSSSDYSYEDYDPSYYYGDYEDYKGDYDEYYDEYLGNYFEGSDQSDDYSTDYPGADDLTERVEQEVEVANSTKSEIQAVPEDINNSDELLKDVELKQEEAPQVMMTMENTDNSNQDNSNTTNAHSAMNEHVDKESNDDDSTPESQETSQDAIKVLMLHLEIQPTTEKPELYSEQQGVHTADVHQNADSSNGQQPQDYGEPDNDPNTDGSPKSLL